MTYKDLSPELREEYSWFDQDAIDHEIIKDMDGIYRFKPDPVVQYMYGKMGLGGYDLNDLWTDARYKRWPMTSLMRLWRDTGHSLCSYSDVFQHRKDQECL